MRAADVMTRPVLTVRADDSVEQVAALLTGNNITAAPVLGADGDLIGIVSEGDLLRARAPHGPDASYQAGPAQPHAVVVAEVMTRGVVVMPMDADLSEVAEIMLRDNLHSVPIVDDTAQVAGIISRLDLLRAYVRTDDMIQLDLQHRLDDYAGGERVWRVTVSDGIAEIAGGYRDNTERTVVEVLARTVAGVNKVKVAA
jgi:CBS domain-containing protein